MGTVRALLLADTHLGPGQASQLIDKIPKQLECADVILHAGDITHASLLAALETFAPVHAVRGNNDAGGSLPERLVLEIGGCAVAMVHDSGDSAGRANRLRRWFPAADVVVFGHSHIPWNHLDVGRDGDPVQHQVNPGSAMQRRRQPRCTVGWLQVRDGLVDTITVESV